MDFNKLSDKKILDIATPLMDNLMEGSSEGDYEKLSRDFTDRRESVVTKDNFEKQMAKNTLGDFAKREFLSIIHKKDSIFVLWKQWFTESNDEFLAEIIIIHKDGKFLIDHDWFR